MGNNVDIVKNLYAAFGRGDVPRVLGGFDPAIQWNEAESFRYADGNPYKGPDAIAQGVFQRCVTDIDGFTVAPENIIDGGDVVVVEGRYQGTLKSTGTRLNAQFAHVWRLRDGKVVQFQQYTDTKQWAQAFEA
jgi:ketosteroid isomerase-like protein